jgi:hypothetical protein
VLRLAVKTIAYPDPATMTTDRSAPRLAGTRSESLKFNLRDSLWHETMVIVEWK